MKRNERFIENALEKLGRNYWLNRVVSWDGIRHGSGGRRGADSQEN